ncbi:MAG TPA: flagellar basal body-associated FliL family protein [Fimbriimonadaceae bacterium]|nr:flagellar basal body-associated FliL family protein [Fimbriimonadaceae bacterium]
MIEPTGKKGKKGKNAKGKKGKKGVIPVLFVLLAVLAGGGYFGLKMTKGTAKVEKQAIKLGDSQHIINLGEFLVNTAGGKTYLKATVFLHLAKGAELVGGGGHEGAPSPATLAPYTDAVRAALANQTDADLSNSAGVKALKVKIAKAVNDVYHELHKDEEPNDHRPMPVGGDASWDSQEGPVLIVYLTQYVWE